MQPDNNLKPNSGFQNSGFSNSGFSNSGFQNPGKPNSGFQEKNHYPFGKELKKRSTRRAFFHDYRAPGWYMITITANNNIPCFCRISGTISAPASEDSELGSLIRNKIISMPDFTPQLEVNTFVIMPDHIHLLIHIKEYLDRHLGRIIGGMMGGCTSQARKNNIIAPGDSLFRVKFHDRIISSKRHIECKKIYIADNPRRLLIKRAHPDLFKRYLHVKIGNREYAAYGNIFIIKKSELLPIRIHRRWSDKEFDEYEEKCMEEIEKGAIPISPFIHRREKIIRDRTIETGGSLIVLRDIGFEERFKPQGIEFELCAAGRLLLLAPWPDNTGRKSTAGYIEFHSMNDMAVEIAGNANLPSSIIGLQCKGNH